MLLPLDSVVLGYIPVVFKGSEVILMWSHGWESPIWAICGTSFKTVHPQELGVTLFSCLFDLVLFISAELISCLFDWYSHVLCPQYFFFPICQNNSCKLLSHTFSLTFQESEVLNFSILLKCKSIRPNFEDVLPSHEFSKLLILWL